MPYGPRNAQHGDLLDS